MKRHDLSKFIFVILGLALAGCGGKETGSETAIASVSEIQTTPTDSEAGKDSDSSATSSENTRTSALEASTDHEGATALPGSQKQSEETRAEQLLSQMSLEEKAAQMTIVAFDIWNDDVEKCFLDTKPGGFILFSKNISSKEELQTLTSTLALNSANAGVPAFIAVDQEGGTVQRVRFSGNYPKASEIGASNDAGRSYDNGFKIGTELASLNFNLNFAPVMDVNSNPNNPVIGNRSFSDDPDVVSKMGIAMMNGLKDANIIPCLKHFPGHGDTSTDSHTGLPKLDKTLKELWETELKPFKAGIDEGAAMIMTAHIEFPQITSNRKKLASGEEIAFPATLSKEILTDLLREEMGFQGVIVTDSLEMKAISSNFGILEATGYAVSAGADLMLIPVRITGEARIREYRKYISDFADLIRSGSISEERVNESVLRILKLKEKYGFFD